LSDKTTNEDPVVSSDGDELILVDADDRQLGFLDKARCHDGEGVLHRAFSLFVLDRDDRILLQRREGDKRLWPGYWSNACCSHPRRGETVGEAVQRRAREELGIGVHALSFVFKFEYHARFDGTGSEHELCHVYLARTEDEPRPNSNEIDAWGWYAPEELDRMLVQFPGSYTPWFQMEWERLRQRFVDQSVDQANA